MAVDRTSPRKPLAGIPAPDAGADDRQREFHLTDRDFRTLSRLVYDRARIVLRPEKRELLYGRLAKRLRRLGFSSFAQYVDLIEGPDGETEIGEMMNAITTNLTSFFRERHHFDHLAKVALPDILADAQARGTARLRLWSAGCSSGQEPYSIAMTVRDAIPNLSRWNLKILATDLDTKMIDTARQGLYPPHASDGIPDALRRRYTARSGDGRTQMTEELRSLITFNPLNLMDDPWPMHGPFDVIFCRNVVIYFDKPTQAALFDRFADLLTDTGWLYVGHSESLFRVTDRFQLVGQTVYRKLR